MKKIIIALFLFTNVYALDCVVKSFDHIKQNSFTSGATLNFYDISESISQYDIDSTTKIQIS